MKIIVTHMSPDLDAIGSVWVLKKFLPGWEKADVEFVPAGNRLERVKNRSDFESNIILKAGDDQIVHVDTGLGPLDHHQTSDMDTSGVKRAWEFVQAELYREGQKISEEKVLAVSRIIDIIVDYDHFQEVFKPDAAADYHEFSLLGINDGLQYGKPGEEDYFIEFGSTCLDYLLYYFENKVWAEQEMEKGVEFTTKYGKALGIDSMNESVVKLAQKKGYVLVARKDERKGNVSIKTLPNRRYSELVSAPSNIKDKPLKQDLGDKSDNNHGIDLTLAYEQFRKMDPDATWFLHISKKMLLNGSVKNPDMKPTKLSLDEIIKVLKKLYK